MLKSSMAGQLVQPPDVNKLKREDIINDSLGRPYRMACMIPVDYCMDYAGKWDTLASGEIIWRLKLIAPGASAIQVIYNNFYIPKGGKLFLYNEDKSFVIGAFTEENNHPSGVFANEIIPGESCILEYVKSTESTEKPVICISEVGYVYRGMSLIVPNGNSLKSGSGSCEVNVRCSPEGDNYTDVKRSVVKIIMSGYYCSGTLLNNTAQDFKSLISTAYHCATGIESESLKWMFYFNNEYPACSNSGTPISGNTMTGADILAEIPINGGSDAVLMQLTNPIPTSFNSFWAGWDRRDTIFASGAGIHHPAGDATKISTIRSFWRTSTWYGAGGTVGATNAHWSVTFAQTPNGFGVTEGGSSGSGLFTQDGLFHGQLSGGSSKCTNTSGDNLYGKLSYSWDKYGSASNVRLKPWLDPSNTGATRLQGIDHNTQYGVFWSSSSPVINADSAVQFKDESVYNPTTWSWTFEGGNPASSSEKNPTVTYASPGLYNVSLTVTNDKGTNTRTRTDYIYVKPKPVWFAQNTRFPKPYRGIQGISIVDSVTVWAWAFDGTNPSNPILEYTKTSDGGNYWQADSISLSAVSGYGMSNIYAISKDTAYAAVYGPSGGGKILQTKDGGKNWVIQSTAYFNAPDGFPNIVYFFNRSNGVCIGDPNTSTFEIYTTTNGGTNWSRVSSANIPGKLLGETGTTNYYDAKGDTIWFGTSNGRIIRSIDKGYHWTFFTTGLSGRLDVKFRNSKIGYAFQSSDSTNNFAMAKTTDGGATWSTYTVPDNVVEGSYTGISKSSATWVNVNSTPGGSSFSTDDGTSFTLMDSDNPYTAVSFYNDFIGWAGSYNKDSIHGGMYKWSRQNGMLTPVRNLVSSDNKTATFTIQPNPASEYFEVTSAENITGDVKVSIASVNGSLIDHFTFRNNEGTFRKSVGIVNLKQGMYLVIIQAGTKVETHKLLVR